MAEEVSDKGQPSVKPQAPDNALSAWKMAAVWGARVLVGGLFVMSGITKLIDLHGFALKISEYIAAAGFADSVPGALVTAAAVALSLVEFMTGFMTLAGCYRRSSVVVLSLFMALMLPLTLWTWVADPVADCGCFGDFLKISNAATFWKNVVLTALIVWPLWPYNRRVTGVFSPYSQWLVAVVIAAYGLFVGVRGYNVQPLADFRRFPVGTQLADPFAAPHEEGEEPEEAEYEFVYADKDGKERTFTLATLPADPEGEGLTFVDRRLVGGSEQTSDGLSILGGDDDADDITSAAIPSEGDAMIVAIARPTDINPGQTFYINELSSYMRARGGKLLALLGDDADGLDYWEDIAMADYPVYTLEPSVIRELVRGRVGLVYLRDGRILWKRTLRSVDIDDFSAEAPASASERYATDNGAILRKATLYAAGLLAIILALDKTTGAFVAIARRARRGRHQKGKKEEQNINP